MLHSFLENKYEYYAELCACVSRMKQCENAGAVWNKRAFDTFPAPPSVILMSTTNSIG
jgi:hypothetical protein